MDHTILVAINQGAGLVEVLWMKGAMADALMYAVPVCVAPTEGAEQ